MDPVLQALLPEGMIIPSAFDTVGHIAHLNLRDEHLPYKWLIAKVVLDKNKPRIQTVVNKIDTIQNEYKTMQLEVLAGNHSLVTTVVENGIRFARKKDQMEEVKHKNICIQLRNYSSMEGVLYCKPHFEQLFKESGFFSKKFQSPAKLPDKTTHELWGLGQVVEESGDVKSLIYLSHLTMIWYTTLCRPNDFHDFAEYFVLQVMQRGRMCKLGPM
ncbi:tRNA (guanine(37)-N1)-methyltransferase 1 [Glycine soja]